MISPTYDDAIGIAYQQKGGGNHGQQIFFPFKTVRKLIFHLERENDPLLMSAQSAGEKHTGINKH